VQEEFPVAYYGLLVQSGGHKYKYLEYPSGFELYDLINDPHEVDNIFNSAPQVSPGDYGGLWACLGMSSCMNSSTTPTRRTLSSIRPPR
jgi:hypothetical protein